VIPVNDFPLPGSAPPVVAVPAPGPGVGFWNGSPSATLDHDGSFLLAYRLRMGTEPDDPAATIVARSDDGEAFTTSATLDKSLYDAMSMERPALVRTDDDRWRLYTCCATKNSKHWWIDVLEADDPANFADAEPRTVFPGDEHLAVKDPIVQRLEDGWQAWICCHPLDEPGEEDRMFTAYATSDDGLTWDWRGIVLSPRPGMWDARGTRLTAVLPDGRAAYDGRASAEENWHERTGLAQQANDNKWEQFGDVPVSDARYLDIVVLPDGGYRIFYEAPLPDESHELRTELIRADGA
jgi:hypothetical protein